MAAPTPITDRIRAKLLEDTAAYVRNVAPPSSATMREEPILPLVGPQTRPNGQVYQPRLLENLEDLAVLRSARDRGEHTLLTGQPGTGKTAMAEAAFVAFARPGAHTGMETIVGSADTTDADFVGTFVQDPYTGHFTWIDGPLIRSMRHGIPLLVDEIALIPPTVLSVLYPLMDGRRVLHVTSNPHLPPIEAAEGWAVIGACNPHVPGADLSEALASRFTHHIEVPTDWDLAADLGVPEPFITAALNLETRTRAPEVTYDGWIPQLRDGLAFATNATAFGLSYALAAFLRRCPAEDREEMREALSKVYSGYMPQPLALGSRSRGV
ncbi:AAA family ATPase [Kitasatospora sp. NPDC088783]|uniref:AAA family ATPase n=1 Tax=Kitasatospora sp. NPDC088783 TaxID=3364077 RepID=UPI003824F206